MVSVISGRLDLRFALFAGRKSIRLFPPSSMHNTTIPIQSVSAVGVPTVWAGGGGGVAGSALFVRASDRPPTCEPPACVEANLEAGGGLFIPAGWFHEVTSFAADGNEEQHGSCAVTNCSYGLERSLHAAVNFWFAPPSAT